MKYIGNVFGIYALIESGEEMYAIDTHAAHERVLYEKYLEGIQEKKYSFTNIASSKYHRFGCI